MAASVQVPVYGLLMCSLSVLFVYWERALAVPQSVLVAAFSVYSLSNFVLVRPRAGVGRKFATGLVLTFADICYTTAMLGMSLGSDFWPLVAIYVFVFLLLQYLHPRDRYWELQSPLFRGLIYLSTGFFMAVGVAQGLESALQPNPTYWRFAHAALIVIGKQILTTCVYIADSLLCDSAPEVDWRELEFNAKAGSVIFGVLAMVWTWMPVTNAEFTWCAFVSNLIYQLWAAFDTISHQKLYSKVDLS